MTADLAASCATIAALLPAAQVLMTEPDHDGTTGGGKPGSRPPWNGSAAAAAMDAHEGLRRLEASLRIEVTGHPGRRRGGSDANTAAAIKAIEALGSAVTASTMAQAARILDRWSRQIQELPAIDEAERARKIAGECPYCGFAMMRAFPRSGQVTCLRHGACYDANGQHPIGRIVISQLDGSARVAWNDGLVT